MNQLKVNQQQTIIFLHERGWSKRKIARELGVDRVTVRKYIAAAKSPGAQTGSDEGAVSNSPTPQTGFDGQAQSKITQAQTGSAQCASPKSPTPQIGSVPSLCAPWREKIEQALATGLSVQRITRAQSRLYPATNAKFLPENFAIALARQDRNKTSSRS